MMKYGLSIVFVCSLLTIMILIGSCATNVCPDKTTVEVGVTETDSKNDKLQEKKSVTQTWKWGKSKCNES